MKITIATRKSPLALWQAEHVKRLLEENEGVEVDLLEMTTRGDKILDQALSKVGGKDLFVKEIEHALIEGAAQVAVHSLKDMPTVLPAGLALAALALSAGCSRQPETLTPEAARAKGDELLRQMSRTLAAAQAFSYRADQSIERVRAGGERVTEQFSQLVTVRRPNQVAFTEQGADRDVKAWYDGKRVTYVSDGEMAAALADLNLQIAGATERISVVRIQSSKGL